MKIEKWNVSSLKPDGDIRLQIDIYHILVIRNFVGPFSKGELWFLWFKGPPHSTYKLFGELR